MSQKLIVEIVGDTRQLERSFGTAGRQAQTFGTRLRGLGTAAGFAAGTAGLTALTFAARAGVHEWVQHQKVAAQTAAVLKSTGNAAGITAKHVGALATQVMNYSGIDDEAIQATENLVLGFTNIRNAAGKGNDIFDRTVKLITDYSVRTGKDASGATVLFGKALNDIAKGKIPTTIRGIGALSDATRKEIKAHVDAGDVIGAQAILLKTLEARYGGAARAAGQTLPGQLDILKEKFNNLAGQGVAVVIKELQDLAPVFTAIGDVIKTLLPIISPIARYLFDNIVVPFKVIADLIHGDWAKAWADLKVPVIDAVNAIKGVFEPVWNGLKALNDVVWGAIQSTLTTVWNGIATLTRTVASAVQMTVTTAWNTIKTATDTVWAGIRTSITATWAALKTGATTVWEGIRAAIMTPINVARGSVLAAVNAIRSTVSGVFAALRGAVSAEWSGIRNAITGAINAAKGVVVGAVNTIKHVLNETFDAFKAVPGKLKELIVTPINHVIDLINGIRIPGFSISIDTHLPGVGTIGFDWGGYTPFHIPHLAQGGIVTGPTVAMIGEAGPEAVVPLSRGSLGGGMNVTVTVYAATSDPDGLAQQIVRPMVREIQKYARGNSLPGLLGT